MALANLPNEEVSMEEAYSILIEAALEDKPLTVKEMFEDILNAKIAAHVEALAEEINSELFAEGGEKKDDESEELEVVEEPLESEDDGEWDAEDADWDDSDDETEETVEEDVVAEKHTDIQLHQARNYHSAEKKRPYDLDASDAEQSAHSHRKTGHHQAAKAANKLLKDRKSRWSI
jgi:hypothetical protein